MQSGIYIEYFLRSKILLAVHTRVARDHSKPTQEEGKSPVPFCDSRLPRKKKEKKSWDNHIHETQSAGGSLFK